MKDMIKKSPVKAGILGLIILMLLFSGVQTTRAALTIFSDDYYGSAQMQDIAITLLENGEEVEGVLPFSEIHRSTFNYGTTYPEVLAVRNNGTIDEYVRVIVHKYWAETDNDGNVVYEDGKPKKISNLDPRLIELHPTGNWKASESPSGEQTIFYLKDALGTGKDSPAFVDSIKVNGQLVLIYQTFEVSADGKTTTYKYLYDGKAFVVEAEAQGVQTHNAADAVTSAWGSDAAKILNLQNSSVNQNTELKEG